MILSGDERLFPQDGEEDGAGQQRSGLILGMKAFWRYSLAPPWSGLLHPLEVCGFTPSPLRMGRIVVVAAQCFNYYFSSFFCTTVFFFGYHRFVRLADIDEECYRWLFLIPHHYAFDESVFCVDDKLVKEGVQCGRKRGRFVAAVLVGHPKIVCRGGKQVTMFMNV